MELTGFENVGNHPRFLRTPVGMQLQEAGVEVRAATAMSPHSGRPYVRRGAPKDAYIPGWCSTLLRVLRILTFTREDGVLLLRCGVENENWATAFQEVVDGALARDPFNFIPIRRFLQEELYRLRSHSGN